jgi:hypothetical protein
MRVALTQPRLIQQSAQTRFREFLRGNDSRFERMMQAVGLNLDIPIGIKDGDHDRGGVSADPAATRRAIGGRGAVGMDDLNCAEMEVNGMGEIHTHTIHQTNAKKSKKQSP